MKFALLLFLAVMAPNWAVSPGGMEEIDDLESDEVLAAANAAVSRVDADTNSIYKTLLVAVTDGTLQVVSGKMYVLTMIVGLSSDCKKGVEMEDATGCHISRTSRWTATIICRPWHLYKYDVYDLDVVGSTREGGHGHGSHMLGAPVPISDLHSESVLAAAEVAVTQVNKMSNAIFKTVLVDVVDGTSQVVSGIKYTMTLLVGRSQCKNDGEPASLHDCPAKLGTVEKWHAVVWQLPTLDYKILELQKVKGLH